MNQTHSPLQRRNDSYEEHHNAEPTSASNNSNTQNAKTSRFGEASAGNNNAKIAASVP